jgi:hypothetical protein
MEVNGLAYSHIGPQWIEDAHYLYFYKSSCIIVELYTKTMEVNGLHVYTWSPMSIECSQVTCFYGASWIHVEP